MKKYTVITLLVASGCFVKAQSYQNIIEMVEIGESGQQPLLWTMPGKVAADGKDVLVGEAVPPNGAVFILSTILDDPFQSWQLDQTAVGAYLPVAEVKVKTHDMDSTIKRTRADQPYYVQVAVSGLYDASSSFVLSSLVQDSAKKVNLQLFAEDYPAGSNSLLNGRMNNPFHEQYVLEGNGNHPLNQAGYRFYSSLNPQQPEKGRGEEHIVVQSLPDGAYEGGAIAQQAIQVWPVWHTEVSGLENATFLPYSYDGPASGIKFEVPGPVELSGTYSPNAGETVYEGAPPKITFKWQDLFPTSAVAIVVSDPAKSHPWGGRMVSGTRKIFNENASFNYELTLEPNEWGDVFANGNGRYAIWIVAETPGIGLEAGGQYEAGDYAVGGWVIAIEEKKLNFRGSLHSLEP